jgi:Delta24-sterol reductase
MDLSFVLPSFIRQSYVQLVPMGNHWLFRWLLGWLMPPRVSALKLTMTPKMIEYYNSKFVAQDILVPAAKTGECMELMHDIFEIYPLWLCAHKVIRTRMGTMLDVEPDYDTRAIHLQGDTADAQMYVDVGIWSTPTPILDFWRMFDKNLYAQARRKYGGERAFFDVYRKVGKC